MVSSLVLKPKGILNPQGAEKKFQLARYLPTKDLSCFVERYWIIKWDLRGQEPYVQETLPYPCVNLVFEQDNTRVYGIDTRKFSRVLEGCGQVLGVKFKPGGFYPFTKMSIASLTDRSISFCEAFGVDVFLLETSILSLDDDARMVEMAETFLRERQPKRDPNSELVSQIVDCIVNEPSITRVDDIVQRLNLNKRTLQRLFNQYVGVSPKWVIRRSRLHEAAQQLADGQDNLTRLALDVGYFDQAHFIKDFKTIVGQTPAEYARSISAAS